MAELILFNANIISMDPAFPVEELIAVQGGKVLALGRNQDLDRFKQKGTALIDCRGRTVLPGFIDAHLHFHGFAESLVTLDLSPRNRVHSIAELRDRIRQFSKELPPGTWIRARGYNEFYLAEKRHPTRWDLDEAAPSHPIKLTHRSGRANVLNSMALRLVNISREMEDPPEGLIDRHIETGEPTGLVYGMAESLAKRIPLMTYEQMERGVKLANTKLCSLGITSIHDASPRNDLSRWEMFRRWKERGLLKTRVSMALGQRGFEQFVGAGLAPARSFSTPLSEDHLNIRGVKIIVHETTGKLIPGQEDLDEMVLRIHRSGLQAILHAIEGTPVEAGCAAIGHALEKFPNPDHRHRIEHCSLGTPSLARRLASAGVTVVTQPSFIYYNGDRYLKTVPASNLNRLYPIRTFMENGVPVAGSSDCPVVPADPLKGIFSALSRETEAGRSILPGEKIAPVDAIKLYTEYAARATLAEKVKGSITPGKVADLVVLSGDPTRLPADEVKDLKVEMTLLNGEMVWNEMS